MKEYQVNKMFYLKMHNFFLSICMLMVFCIWLLPLKDMGFFLIVVVTTLFFSCLCGFEAVNPEVKRVLLDKNGISRPSFFSSLFDPPPRISWADVDKFEEDLKLGIHIIYIYLQSGRKRILISNLLSVSKETLLKDLQNMHFIHKNEH